MTAAEFKENLPYLHVRHNGKIYLGKTGGRLLPFCHVSLYDETGPIAGSFEVSWETAVRCYNECIPVVF